MPFVEIQPVGPVRGIGTGVRLTMTEERGLRSASTAKPKPRPVTLAGRAGADA